MVMMKWWKSAVFTLVRRRGWTGFRSCIVGGACGGRGDIGSSKAETGFVNIRYAQVA